MPRTSGRRGSFAFWYTWTTGAVSWSLRHVTRRGRNYRNDLWVAPVEWQGLDINGSVKRHRDSFLFGKASTLLQTQTQPFYFFWRRDELSAAAEVELSQLKS